MDPILQPILANERAQLIPLTETDFDRLYPVAADPAIWAQHPNKDRWREEVFRKFFEGAMLSKGAFLIIDQQTGQIAGSTRFYDLDPVADIVMIGYTFYATRYWGTGLNPSVKKLMMDHIFNHVGKVGFHVGATNIRSQIAVGRLGATKIAEEEFAYFGEPSKLNFVYQITKNSPASRIDL